MSILCTLFVFIGVPDAHGADTDPAARRLEDSPRHHEWVEIKSPGDRVVRAFVVFPEVSKPAPAVLVIHENRGLTDWVRSVADRLAEEGYVAMAPDLLSGAGPDRGATASFSTSDAAREAIYKLPDSQVLSDLDACFAYLRELKATDRRVAVAGFCWGGSQSFRYVAHNGDIAAAFVFYGSAPADEDALGKIKAPVYGFYGADDFRITSQVAGVKASLDKLGKRFEPETYAGAGHAFMRSGEAEDASGANRAARDAAWQRWLTLLNGLRRP